MAGREPRLALVIVIALWIGCSSSSTSPSPSPDPPAPSPARPDPEPAPTPAPTLARPLPTSGLQLTAPDEANVLAVFFASVDAAASPAVLATPEGAPGLPDYDGAGVLVDPRTHTYLRRAGGEDLPDPAAPTAMGLPRDGLSASRDVLVFTESGTIERVVTLTGCDGCPPLTLSPGEVALVMPEGWAAAHDVGPGWDVAIDI